MLDLETLGNGTSPVITQISAVAFDMDTGETKDTFNVRVNPMSGVKSGFDINEDTVKWWLKQDKSIIETVICGSISNGEDLNASLNLFSDFINNLRKEFGDVRVWGNGAVADNRWLMSAYEKLGLQDPIKFWEHRDVRTLVELGFDVLGEDIKANTPFEGEKHNAIDDCKHQIKYVTEIYRRIK